MLDDHEVSYLLPVKKTNRVERRGFLRALILLGVASFAAPLSPAQGTGSPKLHVDSQRLQGTLERLSEFGRDPEGGVTRRIRLA